MRILDRYIVRELVIPIVFCTASLIFLILIADIFDNMDDMIHNHTPINFIVQYYLAILPISFTQIIAWACLLGTIYLLVHLNHHSEVVAMKAAGLNISTIVRPILFVGFIIGIFSFVVADKIVPKTYLVTENIKRNMMEKKYDGITKVKTFHDVTYSTKEGRLYYIETLNPSNNSMEHVVIIFLDAAKRIKRRVMAESASYKNGVWTLEKILSYETDPGGKLIGEPDHIQRKAYPEIIETPKDFKEAAAEGDFLSHNELQGHINKLEDSGLQASSEKTDLQAKLATPWQSLIMILVAIIFLAKTSQRKAVAMNVLVCLLIIFTYYVTNSIFMAIGKSGAIAPFISAWAANFLFAAGCIFFFEKGNE